MISAVAFPARNEYQDGPQVALLINERNLSIVIVDQVCVCVRAPARACVRVRAYVRVRVLAFFSVAVCAATFISPL
jgi:hypothetical protein